MTSSGSSERKGGSSGEHLVKDRPQRVEVAPRVDEAVGAAELLGGCVEERPAELIVGIRDDRRTRGGAIEVDQRRGVGGVEHDVGGVDVAMNHVARVHVGEDLGQPDGEVEEGVHLERTARPVAERDGARVFEVTSTGTERAVRERNDLLYSRRLETPEHSGLMQERRDRRGVRLARFDCLFDQGAAIRPDRSGHDESAPAMDLPRLRRRCRAASSAAGRSMGCLLEQAWRSGRSRRRLLASTVTALRAGPTRGKRPANHEIEPEFLCRARRIARGID